MQGESGTVRRWWRGYPSRVTRKDRPFVAINCAALPEQLLESGCSDTSRARLPAHSSRRPANRAAAGSVLFLDEVTEMVTAQAKFLRVLQEREFQRLGGTRTIKANVRVIAATNRDLRKAVEQGAFREDLYYRLQVFEIGIPALRDRKSDVLPLADAFLQDIARSFGRLPAGLTADAKRALMDYSWPGNARELRNALERAAILCEGGLIAPQHLLLPAGRPAVSAETTDLNEVERHDRAGDAPDARQQVQAAKRLGLTRTQLYGRLRKYGFDTAGS